MTYSWRSLIIFNQVLGLRDNASHFIDEFDVESHNPDPDMSGRCTYVILVPN